MRDLNCMVHNLKKDHPDPKARRESAREAIVLCKGGIGGLNEINSDDVSYIKSQLRIHELRWFRRGELAIIWDPSVISVYGTSWRMISRGGYVGADETLAGPDNRRVGPTRYALKFRGYVVSDMTPIQWILIHKVAKAFTEHKWRQRIWRRSTRRVSRFVNRSIKRFPNGVITGDENAPFPVDYPNLNEVTPKTPPTLGRVRYDQIHTFGAFKAMDIKEFATPSDHDGLKWRLRRILGMSVR